METISVNNFKKPEPTQETVKTQKWILEYKEQAYKAILKEFEVIIEKMGNEYVGKHLFKLIEFGMASSPRRDKLKEEFTDIDLSKIYFIDFTSDSASKVADREINRGVFVVTDDEVYKKLENFFGIRIGVSHGVVLGGSYFSELPYWRDVGVILTKNISSTITHELRHTIDPYLYKRNGYNRIIEELFAEYHKMIVEGLDDWNKLRNFLLTYKENYESKLDKKMNDDEWNNCIDQIINQTKILKTIHGDIKTQRMIIQAETIKDFLNIT